MEHMKELLDALEGMHKEAVEREAEAADRIQVANDERNFWNARRQAFWNAHQGLVQLMNNMAKQEVAS